jgi:hypothetical protein
MPYAASASSSSPYSAEGKKVLAGVRKRRKSGGPSRAPHSALCCCGRSWSSTILQAPWRRPAALEVVAVVLADCAEGRGTVRSGKTPPADGGEVQSGGAAAGPGYLPAARRQVGAGEAEEVEMGWQQLTSRRKLHAAAQQGSRAGNRPL